MSSSPEPKKSHAKKWLKFTLRWSIAVFGIWYVVSNMSLHDRVLFLDSNHIPVEATLAHPAPPLEEITRTTTLQVTDPATRQVIELKRPQLVNRPDQKHVTLRQNSKHVELLALDLTDDTRNPRVRRLLVKDPATGKGEWITPNETVPDYVLNVPYPIVDQGLVPMVQRANPAYLWASILVFPIVYFITAYRWHALLQAVGIMLPQARTFVLNMVGAFYNTFMPGSTGGDLLKAYYASMQTPHKMRAVMTVVVDRILGLLALVLMGGAMAAYEYFALARGEPARPWCGRVAFGSLVIVIGTIVAGKIAFQPMLRRALGLEYLLARLPAQRHLVPAIETMRIYRQRKSLLLWAVLITLPVHATVVVSALFAGKAFNLPMHALYYWVVVPVVVLSGAIPISPQGAGVMEFFAILLTRREGVTISGAFALTMSIRVVQILWNLTGGIFVLRGGYHAPTEQEAKSMEEESGSAAERATDAPREEHCASVTSSQLDASPS
jgi:uncharacterized membrane protein YbhN (UPF0104 family)